MDYINMALDMIERKGLENDSDIDGVLEDEETVDESIKYQDENRYNRLLPYDCTEECQQHLMRIKASIAKCTILNQATVYEWFIDLERFVDLNGLAFTKEDHVYFVKLLYEMMVSDTSMDLHHIAYATRCFSRLLKKRHLLSREDLQLDWRPLYEAYDRLLFSETEALGLRFVPDNLESNLCEAISYARTFFPVEATEEMLEVWRPMLCPFSVAMQRAVIYLNLFLPTDGPAEHHNRTHKLWFEEIMKLWLSGKVSIGSQESKLTLLLSRLSSDCLGYIDWEPYIPRIFNHFKSSMIMHGSVPRNSSRRSGDSGDIVSYVKWMVYIINQQNSCLDHVTKLFKAIESFYHPSNTDRLWFSIRLQHLLYAFPSFYVKRLYRERFRDNEWSRRVPKEFKLTNEQTSKFVDSLLPVALTAMFNQNGIHYASATLQDLAALRPEKVIPPLLDRLYGSYETLTEPLRLVSSINCMALVIPAMVKPCKYFPEGPSNVVPLLLNSLPGIDSNDMRKCLAVFRFIATIASHIRIRDYSYLVDERPDLTNEQQQLCFSTAKFEDFVIQFLDKCFALIENTASVHSNNNLDHASRLRNGEEGIVEAAICSITLSILAQASPEIQQAALDKLYSHVTMHIFDTKNQGKAIATLCLACAKASSKETLAKFVPHFGKLIMTLTDNNDVFQESTLDDELLFSLLLMSEIVRCNSHHLLDHKEMIVSVIQRALRLNSKEGYMLGCSMLRHLLKALTNITCCDWRNIDLDDENNKAVEEKWPFDNWGHTISVKELKIKWEIPSDETRSFAQDLLEMFMKDAIKNLELWLANIKQLTRDEVQRSLHTILNCLVGAAAVLPPLDAPVINLACFEVPGVPMCIKNTGTEPLNFRDGTNIRTWLVQSLRRILTHTLATCEDDTKSLSLICEIFGVAMSYFGYNKTELRIAAQRIKTMKCGIQNKLLGSKRHVRQWLVERVAQQHRAMLLNKGSPDFTELHFEIFKCLFVLAQSHYVEIRVLAQDTVYMMLNYFPGLETKLVPMIVQELKKSEIEHNKFKGLLYLVIGRRAYSPIVVDPNWDFMRQLWPALVESPYSEKLSIVKLMDRICGLVQKNFDTFDLRCSFSDSAKKIAIEAWDKQLIDVNLYPRLDEDYVHRVLQMVEEQNGRNVQNYEGLVLKLVQLVEDPQLHWHRKIIAYSLFTHLMRDDHPLPLPAFEFCLACLISERLSIRLKALQLVSAQLKLQKRHHLKHRVAVSTLNDYIESCSNDSSIKIDQLLSKTERLSLGEEKDKTATSNTTKVLPYSNKWLQYKLSDNHYTKDEWSKLIFVDKPHIGFYDWPKEVKVYESYEKQPQLNRDSSELNKFEIAVHEKFNDANFVKALVAYFLYEENKGAPENHRFDLKRPSLYKGLFRNFGPCMIEPFCKYINEFVKSSCDLKQRFVIEFIAGLLRGSKHWSYEMLLDLKDFVLPILDQMPVTQENYNDWTGLANYVFRHRDVRRFNWLLNYFIKKAVSESESTASTVTPFMQASRLTLAHYSLIQCEWRAVDHIFPFVIDKLLAQDHLLAYSNVRTCLASIYSLIYMYDDPTAISRIPGTLLGSPKRSYFIEVILPKLAILDRARHSSSQSVASDSETNSTMIKIDSKSPRQLKKKARLSPGNELSESIASLALHANSDKTEFLVADTIMKYRQIDESVDTIKAADDIKLIDLVSNLQAPEKRHGGPAAASGHAHLHCNEHHKHAQTISGCVETTKDKVVNGARFKSITHDSASFVENLRQALPDLSGVTSAVANLSGESQTVESEERRDAMKLMKLTTRWIIYNICRLKSPVPCDFFKLLPIICEMARENNDPELAADSLAAVAILGGSTLSPAAVDESMHYVHKIIREHSWHARVSAAAFIEIMISSNLFQLLSSKRWREEIEDLVINHLICDERIEVRESSSLTLSGMIHCEFTQLTTTLLNEFKRRADEPIIKKKQPNGTIVIDSRSTVIRHSGILCLCACVDAHPYTVPDYLPDILTRLCDHLTDPQPISTTIKKTMSNFRRTHHDNWQNDKTKFTDDQLCVLADLLVSPSYYA